MAERLKFPRDSPDCTQSLSRKLFNVMEDIGVSTDVRDARTKHEITMELLSGTFRPPEEAGYSYFTFGSSFEGTSTLGLCSDTDKVLVFDKFPVVIDISDAKRHKECLLMLQECSTPAGYVKLQYVVDGVPQFRMPYSVTSSCARPIDECIDERGRKLFSAKPFEYFIYFDEKHGPALNSRGPLMFPPTDLVPATRCRRWPNLAAEWLFRQRQYDWPSSTMVEKCKRLGCFFVNVGHPSSNENIFQWRISFSLQERLLVTQFNSVQLKCFVILKMIKKDIIYLQLKEDSISSYHCKTCLFYMIENTPADFWVDEKLLTCLYGCLKMIRNWTEEGVCPNYFIPDENMFDRRVHGHVRAKLREVLKCLLESDFKFLLEIKSDMLGKRLVNALLNLNSIGHSKGVFTRASVLSYRCVKELLSKITDMLYTFMKKSSRSVVKELFRFKMKLQKKYTIYEHTREATKYAVSLVLPYVESNLMSNIIVLMTLFHKDNKVVFKALTSQLWHDISLKSDSFSSKLKQSSLLYMLGYYGASLETLLLLEDKLDQDLMSLCSCFMSLVVPLSHACKLLALQKCSEVELLNRYLVPCVAFLPSERDLTPSALCYEMMKSTGVTSETVDAYDLAVIDGKILLYYLLFLNHCALGMEEAAVIDVENILRVVDTDTELGHKETAINILGWIYKENGRIDKAVKYFQFSLHIKPNDNAAIWHMQDILNVLSVMIGFSTNQNAKH